MATNRERSEPVGHDNELEGEPVTSSLEDRVTKLEEGFASVKKSADAAYYLASKADQDVAEFTAVQIAQTRVIQAVRDDQIKHGEKLSALTEKMRDGFAQVDERFDRNEKEMRGGFAKLAAGQEAITELITRVIEDK
jgi:hypothetical protein